MKTKRIWGLVLALSLFALTGCSVAPSQAADGSEWSEDWITLGPVLGVEPPEHGLTLLYNNTALTANDMFYAAWTIGEAESYTNADGEEIDLYEAQLDVLVYGCADAEHAQAAVEEWQGRQDELYTAVDRREETWNGQDYALSDYECGSETNPYSRGASAFGVCGKYALSFELNCRDAFDGNEADILEDFLCGCHYGAGISD